MTTQAEPTTTPGPGGGPPPWRHLLAEPTRALGTLASLPWLAPWLASAPAGDGHPVLVLPGLMASDTSTLTIRGYLRLLGYDTHGWRLGRNRGPSEQVLDGMMRAVHDLADRSAEGTVSIVGWSLGGIYARELARNNPADVRQVITLGSPFAMTAQDRTRADSAFARRSHLHAAHWLPSRERMTRPIPVPSTAVYSRVDGIVSWQACTEPASARHQNVEVRCGHFGFGTDAATFWVLADRLAQRHPGEHPFAAPRFLRALYPQ